MSQQISVADCAVMLAREHAEDDENLEAVYWIPHDDEVRLIEVTSSAPPVDQVLPFRFSSDPDDGVPYRCLVVTMHPDDWRRRDVLKWPQGLSLQAATLPMPVLLFVDHVDHPAALTRRHPRLSRRAHRWGYGCLTCADDDWKAAKFGEVLARRVADCDTVAFLYTAHNMVPRELWLAISAVSADVLETVMSMAPGTSFNDQFEVMLFGARHVRRGHQLVVMSEHGEVWTPRERYLSGVAWRRSTRDESKAWHMERSKMADMWALMTDEERARVESAGDRLHDKPKPEPKPTTLVDSPLRGPRARYRGGGRQVTSISYQGYRVSCQRRNDEGPYDVCVTDGKGQEATVKRACLDQEEALDVGFAIARVLRATALMEQIRAGLRPRGSTSHREKPCGDRSRRPRGGRRQPERG